MGVKVFANNLEVCGEASSHKVLGAMPDVCMSPPAPPAGPVPIPYPNFSQASDLKDGSKSVKIGGKPVALKGKSTFKKSKGDEAATKNFGGGVVSHEITGAVEPKAGSFDVKIEGHSVVRTMDLATGNHGGTGTTNGCMGPLIGDVNPVLPDSSSDCEDLSQQNEQAREDLETSKNGKPITDKSIVGKGGGGKGTTVTSGKFRSNDGSTKMATAHNNQKAFEKTPAQLCQGGILGNNGTRKKGISAIPDYSHGRPSVQKSGHTEARIFDAIGDVANGGKLPSGKMTFNIDQRPRGKRKKPSKMPCGTCHKMMCAAMAQDILVTLCDRDNKEHTVPCPSDKKNRKKLKQILGA
jgi:uncharacterized Zn-binding protein involved in type VI secretion